MGVRPTEKMPCPVCNHPGAQKCYERQDDFGSVDRFTCVRCGEFLIDEMVAGTTRLGDGFLEVRHLVSAWIRRQNKAGSIPWISHRRHVVGSDWSRFTRMGFPASVTEKLDALLLAYADLTAHDLTKHVSRPNPALVAEVAAKNVREVLELTKLLHERGLVSSSPDRKITAEGWAVVDDLRKSTAAGDNAFVAMWFDGATNGFRDAVVAAISHCGFKPVIIDEVDYTGFIMDQVVAQIRAARFLVADFTCEPEEDDGEQPKTKKGSRGGVYWEAGFAYGLGKPVIHTCKNTREARRRAHFDVEQYNTIFWKPGELGTEIRDISKGLPDPTLAERLVARILTVVGRGPHKGEACGES